MIGEPRACSKCNKLHTRHGQSYCQSCANRANRFYRTGKQLSPEERKKAQARAIAHYYRRKGVLVPQPCETCGCSKVEMHHPDYSKPRAVKWLCRPCHEDEHDREANKRLGKPGDWVFTEEELSKLENAA